MSSLFADTMRAGLIANATGIARTPEEQAEWLAQQERIKAARAGLCPSDFEYGEDWFECGLTAGHEGDHKQVGDSYGQRWEMTWEPTN